MILPPKKNETHTSPTVPVLGGAGTSFGRNILGSWIGAPRTGADFSHPFTVSLHGDSASVSIGFIFSGEGVYEPEINGVPLTAKRAPFLKISRGMINARGETWVCVEVKPDEDGKLEADEKPIPGAVRIVQGEHPHAMVGEIGRAPLALLRYSGAQSFPELYQIAMFHMRYETLQRANEGRMHFFL